MKEIPHAPFGQNWKSGCGLYFATAKVAEVHEKACPMCKKLAVANVEASTWKFMGMPVHIDHSMGQDVAVISAGNGGTITVQVDASKLNMETLKNLIKGNASEIAAKVAKDQMKGTSKKPSIDGVPVKELQPDKVIAVMWCDLKCPYELVKGHAESCPTCCLNLPPAKPTGLFGSSGPENQEVPLKLIQYHEQHNLTMPMIFLHLMTLLSPAEAFQVQQWLEKDAMATARMWQVVDDLAKAKLIPGF